MRRGGDDAEGRGGGRKLPWSGVFGVRAPTKKDQGASPLNSLNLIIALVHTESGGNNIVLGLSLILLSLT